MEKQINCDELERRLMNTPFLSGQQWSVANRSRNLPTSDDCFAFESFKELPSGMYPNLRTWYMLMAEFSPKVRHLWPKGYYKDKSKCLKCGDVFDPHDQLNLCAKCFSVMRNAYLSIEPAYPPPDEIDNNLWLGSLYTASVELPLLDRGIRRVLSVTSTPGQEFPDTLVYMRVPLMDDCGESLLTHLNEMLDFIECGIQNEEGVLVHCNAGVSRSPSVVIAYLMRKRRWDFETALRYVRLKREIVQPNSGFVTQLQMYEKILDEE